MAKKQKLSEACWAIRVGTFENSQPYFVLDRRSSPSQHRPRLFVTENDAKDYKHDSEVEICYKRDWAIVPVDVMER